MSPRENELRPLSNSNRVSKAAVGGNACERPSRACALVPSQKLSNKNFCNSASRRFGSTP